MTLTIRPSGRQRLKLSEQRQALLEEENETLRLQRNMYRLRVEAMEAEAAECAAALSPVQIQELRTRREYLEHRLKREIDLGARIYSDKMECLFSAEGKAALQVLLRTYQSLKIDLAEAELAGIVETLLADKVVCAADTLLDLEDRIRAAIEALPDGCNPFILEAIDDIFTA